MKKPISKKQAKQFTHLTIKRFIEKMEPFADDIRRLYLREYFGMKDIERALNKEVTQKQIKTWLQNMGIWQEKGSAHYSNMQRIKKRRRLLECIEPHAEEIRKLYLEKYLAPQEIEKRLNKAVKHRKIVEFLKAEGVYQGPGSEHHSIILKKAWLNAGGVNEIQFEQFKKAKKMEENTWAKVCWSKSLEYKAWRQKKYYEKYSKDPEYMARENQRSKLYYRKNKRKRHEMVRAWKAKNPERVAEVRAKKLRLQKERRAEPSYKIVLNLRKRILEQTNIKIPKSNYVTGCFPDQLTSHFESQFNDGMTWENFGSFWDVGLINPELGLNLKDRNAVHKCFHWENLRPEIIPKQAPIDPFAYFRS